MAYENPNRMQYNFGTVNITNGTAQAFIGPKGKAGKLVECYVHATVALTSTTTTLSAIKFGTTTDDDYYASFELPASIAATDSAVASSSDTDWKSKTVNIGAGRLPKDTQIEVVWAAGGSGAGTGNWTVVVDWDW